MHAGRHFTTKWYRGARAQYALWGVVYYFATPYDDVPDSERGGGGEGKLADDTGNGYYNGWQFTMGTWQRVFTAAEQSLAIYAEPWLATAQQQVEMAYRVYLQDHNHWSEWGDTRSACRV